MTTGAIARTARRGGILATGLIALALPAAAQQDAADGAQQDEPGSYADAWEAGRGTYIDACSICHGAFGNGDGLSAQKLDKPPANLTQLSKNNGGEFPWVDVYEIIDGRRAITAHGPRAMPAWGTVWSQAVAYENPRYTETYVRGRILELMLYLDSIQED